LYITLHVLVDPQLPIEQAHDIAERIEAKMTTHIRDIENVTVHIEPYAASIRREFTIEDAQVRRIIKQIVETHPNIKSVRRIVTYVSNKKRYINADCLFEKGTSVEAMHDAVSHIEADIKEKFKEAIVTIHPEPSP